MKYLECDYNLMNDYAPCTNDTQQYTQMPFLPLLTEWSTGDHSSIHTKDQCINIEFAHQEKTIVIWN